MARLCVSSSIAAFVPLRTPAIIATTRACRSAGARPAIVGIRRPAAIRACPTARGAAAVLAALTLDARLSLVAVGASPVASGAGVPGADVASRLAITAGLGRLATPGAGPCATSRTRTPILTGIRAVSAVLPLRPARRRLPTVAARFAPPRRRLAAASLVAR